MHECYCVTEGMRRTLAQRFKWRGLKFGGEGGRSELFLEFSSNKLILLLILGEILCKGAIGLLIMDGILFCELELIEECWTSSVIGVIGVGVILLRIMRVVGVPTVIGLDIECLLLILFLNNLRVKEKFSNCLLIRGEF